LKRFVSEEGAIVLGLKGFALGYFLMAFQATEVPQMPQRWVALRPPKISAGLGRESLSAPTAYPGRAVLRPRRAKKA
jgi:hypothetical protein